MTIKLVAFGIARDILRTKQLSIEVGDGETIATLKKGLLARHPEFASLKSLSFAIGEDYQEDSYLLKENDEVVIIPPVSGG